MKIILTDSDNAVIIDDNGQEWFEISIRENGHLIIEAVRYVTTGTQIIDRNLQMSADAPNNFVIQRIVRK